MMRLTSIVLWAATLLPASAMAQSLGYVDADTPGEAVGMMQTTQLTARVMREQCGNRFPELALEIDANLAKWQTQEAAAIRKSNYHWGEMVKKDASLAKQIPIVEASIRKGLAAVSEIPGEAGTKAFSQVCRQHFAALASGVWRVRTPNAYKYLDAAP